MKTLLNGKKIPCILPLFHGDKFIVGFQEKSEIFNSFFADQCSPISNGSVLPSELPLRTDSSLSSCHFTKDDILQIINNLDPNKAHGHDEISIRMLKICGDSICRPLSIISKAFDKVWHAGLIYKLHQNGICGDLINILNDFLTNRKQRVVLNGQCSSWVDIRAGVPQASILGPLLFLIYVNDLPNGLKSECKLFADDASLFSVAHDLNTSASDINNDLKLISDCAFQWKMSFNPDPSKQAQEIIFSRKKMKSSHPSVYFNNIPVNSTSVHKQLRMLLDDKLSYEHRLKFVLNKIKKTISLLCKFQQILPRIYSI